MKAKNIVTVILAVALILVIAFLILDATDVELRLDLKKYHSAEADGKEFSFYGSFGEVRRVKVKEGGRKLCTLDIRADASAFSGEAEAVSLCDINSDGVSDLLILTSLDTDGDVHRALFISRDGGYVPAEGVDAVNSFVEGGKLISEEKGIRYLAEEKEEYVVPHEIFSERCIYEYRDGRVVAAAKTRVSYFSETDVYCVGEWEYSDEHGELLPTDEDWMDKEQYTSVKAELDAVFGIDLP